MTITSLRSNVTAAAALLGLLMLAGCQGALSMANPRSATAAMDALGASASGEEYLNAIRREYGLQPLLADATLEKAAKQQAGYMKSAGKMAHTTGWGRDFASRVRDNGIHGAAAENVAYGQRTAKDVLAGWMTSSGHRRNMLDPAFGHFGLASAEDSKGRKYWALVLGR
ncbi:MAG: CAP domain-containing protein [Hyphomicrobiales bacterium]|nr:CAP domain-containing protein [Hyphomicrobiales bacterium]